MATNAPPPADATNSNGASILRGVALPRWAGLEEVPGDFQSIEVAAGLADEPVTDSSLGAAGGGHGVAAAPDEPVFDYHAILAAWVVADERAAAVVRVGVGQPSLGGLAVDAVAFQVQSQPVGSTARKFSRATISRKPMAAMYSPPAAAVKEEDRRAGIE